MTIIKSHSCTKCGGVLIIHNDKQQYECPKGDLSWSG